MTSDAVQQIKDRLSILDVVAPYVELHKAGKHFKGKSPFSNERTPSFYVSPERGMYYCFSTNQGGDIFTFIQTMEGVEFKDALRVLAEKAHIELKPEAPERKTERDRSYATLSAAADFFTSKLTAYPLAEKYLQERGVRQETVATWRIGYAPGPPHGGWRELRTHLHTEGYTDAELFRVGLIKQTDSGKEPFDVFRDRIMFPLFDAQGRVVAFSGRILHADERAPKYVNSPETDLYKKSELLFGYDRAKQKVRDLKFWLLVEGQFDVVMAHQAGYTNAVAVSGTALTLFQVQQLERLSNQVVLALDADRAGIAAMQRAATLMLQRGFDVKVASLSGGKDPADLILLDAKEFRRCIGASVHVIEFLLGHLKRTHSDERSYKLHVRSEILPFIIDIPNEIDQDHFISVVATRAQIATDAVRHEVERLREQRARHTRTEASGVPQKAHEAVVSTTSRSVSNRYDDVLYYLVVLSSVVPVSYQDSVRSALEHVTRESYDSLRSSVPVEIESELLFVIERDIGNLSVRQLEEDLADRLNQLVQLQAVREITLCREQIQEAETSGRSEAVPELLATLQTLQNRRAKPPYSAEQFRRL